MAGFITCFGLLPKHSAEKAQKLCGKAYKIFEEALPSGDQKERGAKLGEKITKLATLGADNGARKVNIDFIGCWCVYQAYLEIHVCLTLLPRDTVNAVGLVRPVKLPFTARNDRVRVFRHALALDEHRVRFKPNMWGRPSKTGLTQTKPVLVTDIEEVSQTAARSHKLLSLFRFGFQVVTVVSNNDSLSTSQSIALTF